MKIFRRKFRRKCLKLHSAAEGKKMINEIKLEYNNLLIESKYLGAFSFRYWNESVKQTEWL